MPELFTARDLIWAATLLITAGSIWGHLRARLATLEAAHETILSRDTTLAMLQAIEGRLTRIEKILDRRAL